MLKSLGQVAVFMICAQTLLYLRAKESYEKYIKLIVSMMLLILLVNTLNSGNHGNGVSDIVRLVEGYEIKMQDIISQIQPKEQDVEIVLEQFINEAKEQVSNNVKQDEFKGEYIGNENEAMETQDIVIEMVEVGDTYGDTESSNEEISFD